VYSQAGIEKNKDKADKIGGFDLNKDMWQEITVPILGNDFFDSSKGSVYPHRLGSGCHCWHRNA
jgi:hypothetical protein